MEASPTFARLEPGQAPAGSRLLACQPDTVLCRMASRGNDAAYEALYRRHHRQVYAFVFHMLGGRDCASDAEDIAQDAFARAYTAIGGKRDGSFRHWIMAIARNRAIDFMRTRTQRVVPLHDETVELDPAAAVGCASASAEDRAEFAWIVEAVGALPERQREALVLRELAGMSHAEIAEQLDTTVQATKQLIKRARAGVGEAARDGGVRPRNIRRELTLAAPLAPLLASTGLGVAGAAGAGAAGFGTSALAGKAAVAVLCVAAIGGTTVAVESSIAPAGAGAGFGPVRASAAAQAPAPAPSPRAADELAGDPSAKGESGESGKKRSDRDGKRRARSTVKGHDGSSVVPSTAPSSSGSAAPSGDASENRSGAAAPGFGPAAGTDGSGSGAESGSGGAVAPK